MTDTVTVDPETLQKVMVRTRDNQIRFLSGASVRRWLRKGADTASIAEMLRIREADVWNALSTGGRG